MGAVLEMKAIATCLAAALTLSACGNDPAADEYLGPVKTLLSVIKGKAGAGPSLATLDPGSLAALRQALEADGQPIYLVANPTMKYANLMAPYGQNGDVQTWASTTYETISLRDGMLTASRGFGADLMSAVVPGVSAISAGHGSLRRAYYYLDGADQPHVFDYTCEVAPAGAESVAVLGKSYATRKVSEVCTGPGDGFTNEFWFDQSGVLRQSKQRIAPGLDNLVLQRVID